MKTYREYLKARAANLRADYPDSTPAERREVLKGAGQEWLREIQALGRDAVVPLSVGRSLVAMIGHAEAGRMLRHVANFPECLPANRAKAVAAYAGPVDVGTITEYGLTQKLSNSIRCF